MPESTRYNKLEHESKLVQNIIKMLCYRAETAFANQLAPHYKQSAKQIRLLAKTIIKLHCDITENNENKTLNITLYSFANPIL
jgi:aminoglycoside phosphotransferase family enzyme